MSLQLVAIAFLLATGNRLDAQNAQAVSYAKIPGVKPRNVIFILSEDHRYDFVGFTSKVPGYMVKNPHHDNRGHFRTTAYEANKLLLRQMKKG